MIRTVSCTKNCRSGVEVMWAVKAICVVVGEALPRARRLTGPAMCVASIGKLCVFNI